MKAWKNLSLLSLSLLMACSTTHKVAQETYQSPSAYRAIAEIDATKGELSPVQVNKTLTGILHSYVLGQSLLYKFDQSLERHADKAMDSDVYHELQAIRFLVDGFEEHINEMYLELVMITALPKYSDEQKGKAQEALDLIGNFMDGASKDKKRIPDGLEHIVLGNLREKQTLLFDQLKAISQDSQVTQNNSEVISAIEKNMVLLRATRMQYYQDLKAKPVDQSVVDQAVANFTKDAEFKQFRSEVKKISKEMKKFSREVRGRSTSNDTIFPSTSKSGNITGNGYPANTWSITYDDGPGGKTSPTVLKNLQDRKLKATFFMLAKQVEGLPTTAKSISDAGMNIACHSYDHAQLTKVSGAALDKEITGAQKIIETKLGKEIKLFRLPYGAGVSNANIRAKIAAGNMIHVFWNVDTLDWQDKNPNSILARALKQMAGNNNHGVVLFHDIHPQSVIASAMLMDHMIKNKIKVCTVQEVVDQLNKGLADCHQE